MAHPTVEAWSSKAWRDAPLVAVDLEGTGAQDGADEAILEIAAVRMVDGLPDVATAYTTLVNSGRPIPTRPWISPGLTNDVLASAPTLAAVEPDLAARLDGTILVGHNVHVDWRLLHRRCPSITPAALLDTYKLARHVMTGTAYSLTALLTALDLTAAVNAAVPNGQPHRALWDTVGATLLLDALIRAKWTTDPTMGDLVTVASSPLDAVAAALSSDQGQLPLF